MTELRKKQKEFEGVLSAYPDVMNIEQMCEILGGINTKTGYKMLRDGKIKSVKAGGKYLIAKTFVIDFLLCC